MSELRSEMAAMRQLVEQLQRSVADQDRLIREIRAGGAGTAPPTAPLAARTPEQVELEKQLAMELGDGPKPGSSGGSSAAAPLPGPSPDLTQPIRVASGDRNYLNLSFDALVAGGTATTPDIGILETGGHDPSQRGFTVQNAELVLEGAVDPYFRGQGNIVLQIDPQGETIVELEEAYLETTSLDYNLQGKAGQFFAEFGRLNPQHPHTWDFVDQPLVNGRFLGPDGLRGAGVRASWLVPTPFYSELYLAVQNGNGETAWSFRNSAGDEQLDRPVVDRRLRNASDVLFIPRYTASFDLSETQTVLMGASGAFAPNSTGRNESTSLYGVDLYWKWKPIDAEAGFPFVKWQSEAMYRRFEAGSASVATSSGIVDLPAETLRDWGAYSQVVWGFTRGWAAGLRGDYLRGDEGSFDPDFTSGRHWRVSPDLTWYPTEFSKFRIQFNHDHIDGIGSEESLWAQMEFILGSHAAHKF